MSNAEFFSRAAKGGFGAEGAAAPRNTPSEPSALRWARPLLIALTAACGLILLGGSSRSRS